MISVAYAADKAHEASGGGLPQFDSASFMSQGFWAVLSFAILLFLLKKYVLPGINDVLDARTNQIRDDLDNAKKARSEADAALADLRKQLADARETAGKLVEDARQESARNKDQAVADLEVELSKKKASALDEIEQAKRKSMAEIQTAAVEIAMRAAEKLIEKSVEAKDAEKMVEESIQAIEADKDRIH